MRHNWLVSGLVGGAQPGVFLTAAKGVTELGHKLGAGACLL